MTEFFMFILTAAILIGILYPLFKPPERVSVRKPGIQDEEELLEQKEQLLKEIKDIEFDYRLGKLSEEDYRDLSAKFKLKAVDIMKRIDIKDTSQEEKTATVSRGKKSAPHPAPINFCPSCGAEVKAEDNYCSGCGRKLT